MITALLASIMHINTIIPSLMAAHGVLVYVALFMIIFIETGLVVMPFLPGDSILFLCGSLAAGAAGAMNPWLMIGILTVAAILGDLVNFEIGKRFGRWAMHSKRMQRWIKPKYLQRSQTFFERHGNVAIFLGRFIPIIRTLIPFTAGMGKMHYPTFAKYNIIGGATWVTVAIGAGYFFGNIPVVKANFELIMLAIVVISLVPVLYTTLKARSQAE